MTRDIKSLCCLTKQNNPTIFLHFFINTANGSVLFQLTMALILFTKPLSMDVSHSVFFWLFSVVFFFFFNPQVSLPIRPQLPRKPLPLSSLYLPQVSNSSGISLTLHNLSLLSQRCRYSLGQLKADLSGRWAHPYLVSSL